MASENPVLPFASGMQGPPEMLIRQVLIEGLAVLAKDKRRVEEIVGRVDDLPGGSQNGWAAELWGILQKNAIQAGILVYVGYPSSEARFPCISIIDESTQEDSQSRTMGNIQGRYNKRYGGFDANDPAVGYTERLQVEGHDKISQLQIGAWAEAGELAFLIRSVVGHILERDQGRLIEAGGLDIETSESGFQPDPTWQPRIGYVPMIRLTFTWSRHQIRRVSPVPTRVTIRCKVRP